MQKPDKKVIKEISAKLRKEFSYCNIYNVLKKQKLLEDKMVDLGQQIDK